MLDRSGLGGLEPFDQGPHTPGTHRVVRQRHRGQAREQPVGHAVLVVEPDHRQVVGDGQPTLGRGVINPHRGPVLEGEDRGRPIRQVEQSSGCDQPAARVGRRLHQELRSPRQPGLGQRGPETGQPSGGRRDVVGAVDERDAGVAPLDQGPRCGEAAEVFVRCDRRHVGVRAGAVDQHRGGVPKVGREVDPVVVEHPHVDESVDPATAERGDLGRFPAAVDTGVDEDHQPAQVRGRLLGPTDHVERERRGQHLVADHGEGLRALHPQAAGHVVGDIPELGRRGSVFHA